MRGGKRQGSGRKRLGDRVTITVRINDVAFDKLKLLCQEWQSSQSKVIEDLLIINDP